MSARRTDNSLHKQPEFDTYDDDLAWIVDKLADRAGASMGLIFRFVKQEPECVLMATAVRDGEWAAPMTTLLAQSIRQHCDAEPGPVDGVSHIRINGDDQSPPLRALYMAFNPAPAVVIVVAACRTEFSFNLMHETVARRLHPVLSRYVHLWWLHRTERRRAEALSEVLDRSELGVALLDRRGELVFANNTVRKLLDRRDGLQSSGRRLSPLHADDASRFQAALRQAIHTNLTRTGDAPCRPLTLSLRRGEGRRDLLVTAVSLESLAIDPADVAAVLYVVNPDGDIHDALMPACRIYRLTRVEARLVEQLVSGATVAEAAKHLKISLQTARTYLKQVFRKTTTQRQSALIRVMLASALKITVGIDLSLM